MRGLGVFRYRSSMCKGFVLGEVVMEVELFWFFLGVRCLGY